MLTKRNEDKQESDFTIAQQRQMEAFYLQAPGLLAVLHGGDYRCTYFNHDFGEFCNRQDIKHQPLQSIWPGASVQGMLTQLDEVYQTGESRRVTDLPVMVKAQHDTAALKYYDWSCTPLTNEAGHTYGVTLWGIEVTARAKAHLQLSDQQLMFQNIISAAGTALWMINARGQVVFVNQAWIDWTGKPLKAHLGRRWIRSVLPEDRYHVINTYIQRFKNKEPYSVDFRILRTGKELIWIAATGKPRYLADGTFAGYVGSCMDITERKNAEQAAKDSQERFRLIADSAPVLIWMSRKDHRISFLNRQFLDFLGLKSISDYRVNGQKDHIHPDDIDRLVQCYNRSFLLQSEYYLEYRIRNAEGIYRWVAMKGVPRYNEQSVFKGYIGSGMDITVMKEHEQVKNDFIGMASHELKTPITSIKAYVQLLLNKQKHADENDFTKKSLTTVNKQVGRLTRLVADLLDVSKMDSGRLSLNLDHLVLNDAVKEAVDEVQHTSGNHTINYHEDDRYPVVADKDRIAQVVTNLLTNAIKYSPSAKQVDIAVKGDQNEVTVSVQDYGIGISEDDQQRVFNRFYRVEGKNEQTFSGFGIGLFIAAEIIKRHKGKIWLHSERGQGTIFFFKLPVSKLDV